MNEFIWENHFQTRSECADYWHDKSVHLRQASKILSSSWESNGGLYDAGATYRMLMGMSFELMFKAFAVAAKSKLLHTHNLTDLAKNAGFELNDKEKYIFSILSGYIYWEGRYPVPKPSKGVTGPDRIKSQREPFISHYSKSQNIFEDEPAQPSNLDRSDLDYKTLFKIWKKYNDEYVSKYITS